PGGMSGSSNMAGVKEAIVPIEPELLGLAIGRGGINVQTARSIKGIHRIELDEESCYFRIIG
ncbi:hypothetical protein, partial [Salmonella sp. s54836]|uniref:hypothetical protein n=1 Tax=Salmonella sp. s54836 TaxID=3159673 RepID=UPI003981030C